MARYDPPRRGRILSDMGRARGVPLDAMGRALVSTSFALGAACLAAGCSRPRGDRLERATHTIQAANIDRVGRALSSDAMAGRHHASPEADSAAALILHELRGMGIPQTTRSASLLEQHPSCFVHAFSVGLQDMGRNTRFALTDGVDTRVARPGDDFLPLVFSRPPCRSREP
jgi:hypothetical protein